MTDYLTIALRNPTSESFHNAIANANNTTDAIMAYTYMKSSGVTISIDTLNLLMSVNYQFFTRDFGGKINKTDAVNQLYADHNSIAQQMDALQLQPNKDTIDIVSRFVQNKDDFYKLLNLCGVLKIRISDVFLFRCFKHLKFEDGFVVFETMQKINSFPVNIDNFLRIISKHSSKEYLNVFKKWYNEHGFKRGKWKDFYLKIQYVMNEAINN